MPASLAYDIDSIKSPTGTAYYTPAGSVRDPGSPLATNFYSPLSTPTHRSMDDSSEGGSTPRAPLYPSLGTLAQSLGFGKSSPGQSELVAESVESKPSDPPMDDQKMSLRHNLRSNDSHRASGSPETPRRAQDRLSPASTHNLRSRTPDKKSPPPIHDLRSHTPSSTPTGTHHSSSATSTRLSTRKFQRPSVQSPPVTNLRRKAIEKDRHAPSASEDEVVLNHTPSQTRSTRSGSARASPSIEGRKRHAPQRRSAPIPNFRQTLPDPSSPDYALARQAAVNKLSYMLVTHHRAAEGQSLQQLYAQSFKDPASSELLDTLLRSGLDQGHDETLEKDESVERLTVRQKRDWEQYLACIRSSDEGSEVGLIGVVVPANSEMEEVPGTGIETAQSPIANNERPGAASTAEDMQVEEPVRVEGQTPDMATTANDETATVPASIDDMEVEEQAVVAGETPGISATTDDQSAKTPAIIDDMEMEGPVDVAGETTGLAATADEEGIADAARGHSESPSPERLSEDEAKEEPMEDQEESLEPERLPKDEEAIRSGMSPAGITEEARTKTPIIKVEIELPTRDSETTQTAQPITYPTLENSIFQPSATTSETFNHGLQDSSKSVSEPQSPEDLPPKELEQYRKLKKRLRKARWLLLNGDERSLSVNRLNLRTIVAQIKASGDDALGLLTEQEASMKLEPSKHVGATTNRHFRRPTHQSGKGVAVKIESSSDQNDAQTDTSPTEPKPEPSVAKIKENRHRQERKRRVRERKRLDAQLNGVSVPTEPKTVNQTKDADNAGLDGQKRKTGAKRRNRRRLLRQGRLQKEKLKHQVSEEADVSMTGTDGGVLVNGDVSMSGTDGGVIVNGH